MTLAPYAAQMGLTLIALLATALCFYVLGMRHERAESNRLLGKLLRLRRDYVLQRAIVDRAYPDPATRALVARRVAASLGVPSRPDGDPTDKPLAERVHPGGAYADEVTR